LLFWGYPPPITFLFWRCFFFFPPPTFFQKLFLPPTPPPPHFNCFFFFCFFWSFPALLRSPLLIIPDRDFEGPPLCRWPIPRSFWSSVLDIPVFVFPSFPRNLQDFEGYFPFLPSSRTEASPNFCQVRGDLFLCDLCVTCAFSAAEGSPLLFPTYRTGFRWRACRSLASSRLPPLVPRAGPFRTLQKFFFRHLFPKVHALP